MIAHPSASNRCCHCRCNCRGGGCRQVGAICDPTVLPGQPHLGAPSLCPLALARRWDRRMRPYERWERGPVPLRKTPGSPSSSLGGPP